MAKGKYEKWLEPDGLLLLEGWARDGLTDEQIADKIGISRSTLNEWKKKYPDISDTLKKGKEVVDYEVENALLKRALGYSYEEVTKEAQLNPRTGKYELAITKVVSKEIVPDTTAQIFWLKNRKPDEWRDKVKETGEEEREDTGVVMLPEVVENDGALPEQKSVLQYRYNKQKGVSRQWEMNL